MTTERSTIFPIPKNELYHWDDVEKVLKPLVDTDGLIGVKGQLQVGMTSSEIMQPVDIQSHYQQTIQTHSGAMIPPATWSQGNWIDTNGFDKIAYTMVNDANVSSKFNLQWSNDGTSNHHDQSIDTTANLRKGGEVPTLARYVRVVVRNDDTAPHTFNTFIYLKA